MTPSQHRAVVAFNAALAVGAVVLGVLTSGHDLSVGDGLAAVALIVPLAVAASMQVSFQYKGHVDAFDLTEAVLMPVLFLAPGPGAIAIAVLGKLLSQLHLKVAGVKLAFNVAQWGFVAGVTSLLYLELGTRRGNGRDLAALAAATAVGMVCNHAAVAQVIGLASGRSWPVVVREMEGVIVRGWLLASGANLAFGTLFVALTTIAPLAAPLVIVPVMVLAWAQRAYSAALADAERLSGLQAATHELVTTVDPRDSLGSFLEIVSSRFGAGAVELALIDSEEVHHGGPTDATPATTKAIADLVLTSGDVVRATRHDAAEAGAVLRDSDRRSCIAVPLFQSDAIRGVLVAYDHEGFDGSREGEVAILHALAAELGSALHRGRLLEELVQEKHRVGEIVERSSDGIFTVGALGEVESWNAAMAAITGVPPEAIVGRGLTTLRMKDIHGAPVVLERWLDLESLAGDVQILTARGEERWLACSYAATFDRRSLIVVARDVTQAREVERLKDDFVATVSHELRTPLTSIRGFATMLLDPDLPMSDGERTEALGMIRKGVRRLERLIFNLLEVSRIEARGTATATSAVDVVAACRRVVAEQAETARDRTIRVTTDGRDAWAHANEMSVEQIIGNLVSNAIKYAPTSPVEVSVSHDARSVIVAVTDHGPGIPEADQERIFERFERLDTPSTQAGTGLGLYIARQLAVAMGGDLTVSSHADAGTRFELRLEARVDLTGDALAPGTAISRGVF